jgi:Ferredoxin-dependent bilin reductase
MMAIWDKIEKLAKYFEEEFARTGELQKNNLEEYSWHNKIWTSARYRRAHVQIVDHRDQNNIYILHVTIFPHYNDPSPIFGFDAVCGPKKITGAFHDFSSGGDSEHFMYKRFSNRSKELSWNKPRELPDWGKRIFSESIVAAGNIQEETEIDQLCQFAIENLDYYLKNVGLSQESMADFHMAQNRYCYWQKQNPYVIKSMVTMGIPEITMKKFVENVLFPEHKY